MHVSIPSLEIGNQFLKQYSVQERVGVLLPSTFPMGHCFISYLRIETIQKNGLDWVKSLGRKNVQDLIKVIQWNEDNVRHHWTCHDSCTKLNMRRRTSDSSGYPLKYSLLPHTKNTVTPSIIAHSCLQKPAHLRESTATD